MSVQSKTRKQVVIAFAIAVIVLVLFGIGTFVWNNYLRIPAPLTTTSQSVLSIDGQTINVELETTPAEQELGLGGRTGLAPHSGMLFVFPSDAQHMFWMKDMQFSIDMIWFSANGTVLYIQPNVSPDTYPEAFGPTANSRYVLEVPANFAKTNTIKVGDKATLPQ